MRTNIGVSIPNFHDISEIERSLASLPKIRFLLLRFSAVCQTAESNCPDQVQRQQDLQDRHFGFQKEPLCSMVDCTEKLGGLNFPDRLTDSGVSQQLSCYYFQGIPPPLQHLRVLTSKYYCLQKIPEENISCLKP